MKTSVQLALLAFLIIVVLPKAAVLANGTRWLDGKQDVRVRTNEKETKASLRLHHQSLLKAKAAHDTMEMQRAFYSIAQTHRKSMDYERAGLYIDSIFMYKGYSEEFDHFILQGICNTLIDLGLYRRALGYINECLSFYDSQEQYLFKAKLLFARAKVYDQLEAYSEALKDFEGSFVYYQASARPIRMFQEFNTYIEFSKRIDSLHVVNKLLSDIAVYGKGNARRQSLITLQYARLAYAKENWTEAIEKYRECIELRRSLQKKELFYAPLYELAECYWHVGDTALAKEYYERRFNLLDNNISSQKELEVLKKLTIIYEQEGDLKQALEMQHMHIRLQTELLNQQLLEQQARTKWLDRYELRNNEQALALLTKQKDLESLKANRQKRNNRILLIGLLLVLLITFQFYDSAVKTKRLNGLLTTNNALIQNSLAQKETLIKEIHHRVKNNLQVVSSLLHMQSFKLKDPAAKLAIKAGMNRVNSMAILHQNLLHDNPDLAICTKEYINELCKHIFNSYNIDPNRIKLSTSIAPIQLDVDTMIPLGLIINELITNALKYAFEGKEQGQIEVELQPSKNGCALEIMDNGRGMPKDFSLENVKSIGYLIIKDFCKKLNATIEIIRSPGTRIKILFHY